MSLLLVGVSHRTGTVELREKLAGISAADALAALRAAGWEEVVALSTCNRFELYAAGAPERLAELGAQLDALAGAPVADQAYRLEGPAAVRHLFLVAAGLDSMVLGEGQILGQVKSAYESARDAGATAKLTNVLFQRAVYAGKHARAATGIGLGHTSVASVAVELAQRIFGSLSSREALILGAGQMAELTAKYLAAAEVKRLAIANRTAARAQGLASRYACAAALPWESVDAALATADVVVASTGSPEPVLTQERVRAAMTLRRGRPLFVIDIAMPRDVEESVHSLDGVYLYTLSDLDALVRETLDSRAVEIEKARGLVHGLASEFAAWLDAYRTGRRFALRHSEA